MLWAGIGQSENGRAPEKFAERGAEGRETAGAQRLSNLPGKRRLFGQQPGRGTSHLAKPARPRFDRPLTDALSTPHRRRVRRGHCG